MRAGYSRSFAGEWFDAAAAPANAPIYAGTFAGPDVAAAAAPGAIGGGWDDVAGLTWSRAGGAAIANPFPWYTKPLLRPASEAARDVQLRARFTDRSKFPMLCARVQAGGEYYGTYLDDSGHLVLYKYVGGSEVDLGSAGATIGTPATLGAYSLYLRVRTMPDGVRTRVTAYFTDDATGQVLAVNRQTDNAAALAGAGRHGIQSIANAPITAYSAEAINPAAAWAGVIGDSIYAGAGYGNPVDRLSLDLNLDALVLAIGGTTSADWAGAIGSFLAQLTDFGATRLLLMLGANDSKAGTATTPAAYKANLATIAAAVLGAGVGRVVLNGPTYTNADAGLPGAPLIPQYGAACAALDNGGTIRVGDTAAAAYFLAHQGELANESGTLIHPTPTGVLSLAALQAAADVVMYA